MSRRPNKKILFSLVRPGTIWVWWLMNDAHRVGERSFQTQGPETAKLRGPYSIGSRGHQQISLLLNWTETLMTRHNGGQCVLNLATLIVKHRVFLLMSVDIWIWLLLVGLRSNKSNLSLAWSDFPCVFLTVAEPF